MDDARPELRVEVDRERASLYGLSTNDVGFVVRGAINGLEAAKYRTGNDEYDIVVRLREEVEGVLADFAAGRCLRATPWPSPASRRTSRRRRSSS